MQSSRIPGYSYFGYACFDVDMPVQMHIETLTKILLQTIVHGKFK